MELSSLIHSNDYLDFGRGWISTYMIEVCVITCQWPDIKYGLALPNPNQA